MRISSSPIAVTGSTGQLGGRVAKRLAMLGYSQRLIVRNLERAPQLPGAEIVQAAYEDGAAMQAALNGTTTMFLVSGYGRDRVAQHASAVDAAIRAGVEHIVYTSFLSAAPQATFTHAREHFLTEQQIRATGKHYTFLRPNFYLDKALNWFSRDGIVQGPAGNGTISWIARDDIADVAVTVLTTDGHAGATYDLTGPQALTLTQAAELVSQITGYPTSYVPETLEEASASRARFQPSDWEMAGWVSTYVAIATGELSIVSHSVQALAGHPPQTFRDHIQEHPESYQHFTPRVT
jgi:NAD(P)H dehydrogenase (quinone)